MKQVNEWMQSPVLSIDAESTLLDAAKKMKTKKSGYIAVLKGKSPMGLLTEAEIVNFIVDNKLPSETKVKELVNKNFVTISPDDSILDICTVFNSKNLAMLLVAKDGKLVGTLSMGDIIKGLTG